jgi:hypothetical protein
VLGRPAGASDVGESSATKRDRTESPGRDRQVGRRVRATAVRAIGPGLQAVTPRGRAGDTAKVVDHLDHELSVLLVLALAEQPLDVIRPDPEKLGQPGDPRGACIREVPLDGLAGPARLRLDRRHEVGLEEVA